MSRSLGVLTIDLVARTGGFVQGMDKAQRESAKWRKQVDRDLKTIGGGIGKTMKASATAVAVATAAGIALTKQGMDAVRSQADLARSLDTTYDSITALQLAAGDIGLDGLDGSLTRLNRRLGAAEVGSGAAASAVKALQLDLKALSEMDVDERVATIADAIRDSGVSMQRAARFAQDLGFEQQQAAEFFMQGGDAIRAYRDEVDQLGLSLSDIDVQKVVDAQNAMGIFGDLTTAVSQRLAVEFSPILRQVAQDLENAAKETGGFSDEIAELVDTTVRGVAFVASSVDATGRVFSTLGKTVAIIFLEMRRRNLELGDSFYNGPIEAVNELIQLLNIVPGIDITPRALSGIGQQIKDEIAIIEGAIREGQQDIQDGLLAPLAGDRLINYFEDAKAAAEAAAEAALKLRQGAGGGAPGSTTVDAIANQITALERAAATWGMSANKIKLYDLTVQGATDAQLMHAKAVMRNIDAMEQQEEARKRTEGIDKQIEALQMQSDLLGKSARAKALYKLAAEGANDAQLKLADSILETVEAYESQKEAQAALDEQASAVKAIEDSLRTQEEMIEQSYKTRRDTILAYEEATGKDQTDLLMRLNEERNEQLGELNKGYWETYLESAQTAMESMDELVGETLNRFAGGMGDAFESMIFDAESLEDAVTGLAENMARSIINALGQMAAQWLAYQAVQMLTARTTEATSAAAAAATGTAIASAYAPAAAMASLATMGANSAPAMAGIASTTALAQSMSLMGMAHDGIDSVPQTGTWLLQKGERVTTAETSAKLDSMLDDIRTSGGGRGSVNQTINVTGSVDKKTANQIATSTARKQRLASRRFG